MSLINTVYMSLINTVYMSLIIALHYAHSLHFDSVKCLFIFYCSDLRLYIQLWSCADVAFLYS